MDGRKRLALARAANRHVEGVTYPMYKNYMAAQEDQQRVDWANRKRYAAANAGVASPKANEQRVVFMGNSITEGWKITDSSFFSGKPYVNRGIGGQTTSQMLLRFREDVIDLKPKAVIILACINDIAENTGPIPLESIFGNISANVGVPLHYEPRPRSESRRRLVSDQRQHIIKKP